MKKFTAAMLEVIQKQHVLTETISMAIDRGFYYSNSCVSRAIEEFESANDHLHDVLEAMIDASVKQAIEQLKGEKT
jgi:REP element-mobilizing transposase RayT